MIEHGLNIGGTEWVLIIFIGLVLILGTGRLPGAAKKIGRAVSEYNKAKDGIEEHVRGIQEEADRLPKISGPVESEREKLEVIARSAGISPDGKSDDALREMISHKMGGGQPSGQSHAGAAGSAAGRAGAEAPSPKASQSVSGASSETAATSAAAAAGAQDAGARRGAD